jgi:hypothetical protein
MRLVRKRRRACQALTSEEFVLFREKELLVPKEFALIHDPFPKLTYAANAQHRFSDYTAT